MQALSVSPALLIVATNLIGIHKREYIYLTSTEDMKEEVWEPDLNWLNDLPSASSSITNVRICCFSCRIWFDKMHSLRASHWVSEFVAIFHHSDILQTKQSSNEDNL